MIRKERIAKRYAMAFFKMVSEKDLEENERKMIDITSIIKKPEIIKLFLNPAISSSFKVEILKSLSISPPLFWFVLLLLEKGRFKLFPLILMFFSKLVDKERKRAMVILTSAFYPSEELKERLIEKLKGILKMDIILEVKIDEKIIGGGILQIGSRRIDGSISGYLKRIEEIWQK